MHFRSVTSRVIRSSALIAVAVVFLPFTALTDENHFSDFTFDLPCQKDPAPGAPVGTNSCKVGVPKCSRVVASIKNSIWNEKDDAGIINKRIFWLYRGKEINFFESQGHDANHPAGSAVQTPICNPLKGEGIGSNKKNHLNESCGDFAQISTSQRAAVIGHGHGDQILSHWSGARTAALECQAKSVLQELEANKLRITRACQPIAEDISKFFKQHVDAPAGSLSTQTFNAFNGDSRTFKNFCDQAEFLGPQGETKIPEFCASQSSSSNLSKTEFAMLQANHRISACQLGASVQRAIAMLANLVHCEIYYRAALQTEDVFEPKTGKAYKFANEVGSYCMSRAKSRCRHRLNPRSCGERVMRSCPKERYNQTIDDFFRREFNPQGCPLSQLEIPSRPLNPVNPAIPASSPMMFLGFLRKRKKRTQKKSLQQQTQSDAKFIFKSLVMIILISPFLQAGGCGRGGGMNLVFSDCQLADGTQANSNTAKNCCSAGKPITDSGTGLPPEGCPQPAEAMVAKDIGAAHRQHVTAAIAGLQNATDEETEENVGNQANGNPITLAATALGKKGEKPRSKEKQGIAPDIAGLLKDAQSQKNNTGVVDQAATKGKLHQFSGVFGNGDSGSSDSDSNLRRAPAGLGGSEDSAMAAAESVTGGKNAGKTKGGSSSFGDFGQDNSIDAGELDSGSEGPIEGPQSEWVHAPDQMDPEDYFALTDNDADLFKLVEKRYTKKAIGWAVEDASSRPSLRR